jgi:uncharacterized lipoprotein YajG
MKVLLFLLLGFIFLTSCSKERTIHITAKNAVTGVPETGKNRNLIP